MAARRSSRSRSGGGGRRSSRGASRPAGNPLPLIIGGGVVIVVILIAVATMGGDKDNPPQRAEKSAARSEPDSPKEPPKSVRSKSRGVAERNLKDPDTPAPTIPDGVISECSVMFAKAKKQHEDARRAQAAGEGAKFNSLINDSWDTLEELNAKIDAYATWLEEAEMGDWRVPRSYASLQRLIETAYRLRGQIKRIKPNRR